MHDPQSRRKLLFGGVFLLSIALIILFNITLAGSPDGGLHVTAWLATTIIIVGIIMLLGIMINGRPAGALIDNRNRVSLSKFQATTWTVFVLSALITAAAVNLLHGN